MVTITPNKDFLLNMQDQYDQKVEKDLFDFFDFMLSDEIQPITVTSQKELTKHIAKIRTNLLHVHNTNRALRRGQVPNDDDLDKYKFTPIEIVCLILTYLPIVRLKLTTDLNTNDLAVFNYFGPYAGTYQFDTSYFNKLIFIISPNISNNLFKSCHSILSTFAEQHVEQRQKDLVVVGNGLYNRQTQTLEPFDPSYVTTTKIATNYNPDAQLVVLQNPDGSTWDIESWLKDLSGNLSNSYDPATYELFWQIIAATVNPNQVNAKAIFFYSPVGNNGKGTYGQLLKNLVGKNNYSSLPIPAFKHEFMKEKLIGKTLNIADENPVDIYVDDVQDFKAMITGDDIMINRKHKEPLIVQVKAINIQMLNGLPKTRDKSDSFYRRLIIVPFTYSFTNNGEKPYIKHDYMHRPEVLEYVLKKALEMPVFDEFVVPDRSKIALEQYKEDNNSAVEFWNEFEDQFAWDFLPLNFLYPLYVVWFTEEHAGEKSNCFSKKTFMNHLQNHLDSHPDWDFKATRPTCPNPMRIGNRMDADEPLITRYNLTEFMDPAYKGTDPALKRNFQRVDRGRGIIRL